jgi:hypothetical protein
VLEDTITRPGLLTQGRTYARAGRVGPIAGAYALPPPLPPVPAAGFEPAEPLAALASQRARALLES